MRNLHELDRYRVHAAWVIKRFGWAGDGSCGVFVMYRGATQLRVIASANEGWDHLSVSTAARCPTWLEMDYIKRRFFQPNEVAMQLHVTPADHINVNDYVLHIWRPHHAAIPLPPKEFV